MARHAALAQGIDHGDGVVDLVQQDRVPAGADLLVVAAQAQRPAQVPEIAAGLEVAGLVAAELLVDGEVAPHLVRRVRGVRGPVRQRGLPVDVQDDVAQVEQHGPRLHGPLLPLGPEHAAGGPVGSLHH